MTKREMQETIHIIEIWAEVEYKGSLEDKKSMKIFIDNYYTEAKMRYDEYYNEFMHNMLYD